MMQREKHVSYIKIINISIFIDGLLLISHAFKENVKCEDLYEKAHRFVCLTIASMKLKQKVHNIKFIFLLPSYIDVIAKPCTLCG